MLVGFFWGTQLRPRLRLWGTGRAEGEAAAADQACKLAGSVGSG